MREESRIECIIFDMDGTVVDVPYDWPQIKRELDTQEKPILNYLEELNEPERSKKWNILKKHEKYATQKAVLKNGIVNFIQFIKKNEILTALVTNNSKENVAYLLKKFNLEFDLVMTRESGLWKPSADPFLKVFDHFSLSHKKCCVIGDSQFDITAARKAGIEKIFIINKDIKAFKEKGVEVYPSVKEPRSRMTQMIS